MEAQGGGPAVDDILMPSRVLIVDDDRSVLAAVSHLLRRGGYVVGTHDSGFGLAVAVRDFDPDILVLDVDMPGLKGDAALRVLGHLPPTKLPEVLLCSGIEEEQLRARAERIAVRWLRKPFSGSEMLETVAQMVERRMSAVGS